MLNSENNIYDLKYSTNHGLYPIDLFALKKLGQRCKFRDTGQIYIKISIKKQG